MININGNIFQGSNMVIKNGNITIDGKQIKCDDKNISIAIDSIDVLSVDACNTVTVNGNTCSVKTMSGDITVHGDVTGSIQTMSGDVEVGKSVGGNISSMSGDISHR